MKPRRNQTEDTGFDVPASAQGQPSATEKCSATATAAHIPPGFEGGSDNHHVAPKALTPKPEKVDDGPLPADFQTTLAEIRVCEARQRGSLPRREQLSVNARVTRLKRHLKALQNSPPAPWTGSERIGAEKARHSALGLDQARKLIALGNSLN